MFGYSERSRSNEAIEHWKRAIELDPHEVEKLLAFGHFVQRNGGDTAARPYFDLFVALAPPDRFGRDIQRIREQLGLAR